MSEAKVSIVLPAYNAEKYIGKAIKSILNQTHKNFEFIILNDGSTDNTENIILSFKDPRILYIKNHANLGLIQTLNNGFTISSGSYIARMDADDIAHPERLDLQITFLEQLKKPAIVGSNIIIIDTNDKIIKIPRKVHLDKDENFWIKFRKSPLHHPTVMMSREIALKNSPFYQAKDVHIEDYAAWLRVNIDFPIYNLNRALLFYRVHEFNVTKIHNLSQTNNMIEFLKNYYKNVIGEKVQVSSLRSLLFLQLTHNETPDLVFNDILTNASLFIDKFGNKSIVETDVAYTIFNIGLKSGIRVMPIAAVFILKTLGCKPLFNAIKLTAIEAYRSLFFKLFYKLKYSSLLKENL